MSTSGTTQGGPPPIAQMRLLIWSNFITQALGIVARLGVADELSAGPRDVGAIATKVGANPDALHRVMRALAGVGVFAEVEPRVFAHTPLSELLREDGRPSLRHLAIMNGNELYAAWEDAFESVKTGKSVFQLKGTTHYEHLSKHPEEQERFDKAMAGAARALIGTLVALDFSAVRRVVDVGGGDGTLMIGLLTRFSHLQGGVFDQAQVVEGTRVNVAKAGLADRCTITAGSFLEQAPPEADAYVLSRVLHNWNDEDATAILKRLRSVIAKDGRLFILDEVISAENRAGMFLDLQMLVLVGGRERTAPEWEALLAASGFSVTSIRPGVVEARPS